MPGIRIERAVNRTPRVCAWCRYPIVSFDARYSLIVGSVHLGVITCSLRCAEVEARARRRGPLVLQYAGAA